ncbi:MAG: ribose-5-phosphate isomerase RpiA [Vulcanimicrobiaceae bacterium]
MNDEQKRAVGFAAVDRFATDDMRCVGLGTGSTARWAIERVGERVAKGWRVVAVATSDETERLCRERGVPVVTFGDGPPIDVAIDGADEVAPDFSLIKGGGGALFREKAVAIAAKQFIVIVDESKLVRRLGRFPLPVEVVPYSRSYVAGELRKLCPAVKLRMSADSPFMTDNGNHILDCSFGEIPAPSELDVGLRRIHGVVATGIFCGLTSHVLVGSATGVRELEQFNLSSI